MRLLVGLLALVLASGTALADPSIVGNWIWRPEADFAPHPAPVSLCIEFQADGRFRFIARWRHEGSEKAQTTEGRWKLAGERLTLVSRDHEPMTGTVEVDGQRLRMLPGKDDLPGGGLELERTAWCDGPTAAR